MLGGLASLRTDDRRGDGGLVRVHAPGRDAAERDRLRQWLHHPLPEARVDIGLNVLGIGHITVVAVLWLPLTWGIDVTTLPTEFLEAWGS